MRRFSKCRSSVRRRKKRTADYAMQEMHDHGVSPWPEARQSAGETEESEEAMTPYQRHREKWKGCERCSLYRGRRSVVLCRGKLPCDVLFVGEAPGVSEDVLGRPFVGPAGKLLDEIVERALDGQYDYAITNLVACIPKAVPPVVVNKRTDDFDVDITRKGKWGNPFRIGPDGSRSEVLGKYAGWLPEQDALLKSLPELSGKLLGCVCVPLACHGNVLLRAWYKHVGADKLSEPPEESIKACAPRLRELIAIAKPRVLVRVGRLATKHCKFPVGVSCIDVIHPAAILRMDVSQQGLAVQRCVAAIEAALDDL